MTYRKRIISRVGHSLLIILFLQALGGVARGTPNSDLIQAIQSKNIEGVRQALEQGADANVIEEEQGDRLSRYEFDVATNQFWGLWMLTSLAVEIGLGNYVRPGEGGVVFPFKVVSAMHLLHPEPLPGLPPLLMAMQSQSDEALELVELLVQYGADVNAIVPDEYFEGSKKGWTALIAAAYRNDLKMVTLLAQHGADVKITIPGGSHAGDSALLMAEAHHNQEMIDLLIQAGAAALNPDQQARASRLRKTFVIGELTFRPCGYGHSSCVEKNDISHEDYSFIAEDFYSIRLPREAEHID